MTEYRLGSSIALVPFIKYRQRQKEDPIITNKILYIFGVIVAIKIAILLLWI